MRRPPSSADLERILPSDPKREAVDTLRGYDWQRWLTVKAWLALKEEEAVWIEWGEDFTVSGPDETRTAQAKDRNAPISLGQRAIRDLISDALLRDPTVRTLVWTRAGVATERDTDFGEAGISHWRRVAAGERNPEGLKTYLTKSGVLKPAAAKWLQTIPSDDIPAILRRVEWITGEAAITELRASILPLVEDRMALLNIVNPSIRRDDAAARLFERVAEVGTRKVRAERRLTRPDLDDALLRQNLAQAAALLPALQAALSGGEASASARDADDATNSLQHRMATLRRKAGFAEFGNGVAPWVEIANELVRSPRPNIDPLVLASALGRAASSLATDYPELADQCLAAASTLPSHRMVECARIAVLARTDIAAALRAVRDASDADGRAFFFSLRRLNGDLEGALEGAFKIGAASYSSWGAYQVLIEGIRTQRWPESLKFSLELSGSQREERPILNVLAALCQLAPVTRPKFCDHLLGLCPPLDPDELGEWFDRDSPDISARLQSARVSMAIAADAARELEAHQSHAVFRDFDLWLQLEDPVARGGAIEGLKRRLLLDDDLGRTIGFAVPYGIAVDLDVARRWLIERLTVGGFTLQDARAFNAVFRKTDERLSVMDQHIRAFEALMGIADAQAMRTELLIKSGLFEDAEASLSPSGPLRRTPNGSRLAAMLEHARGEDVTDKLRLISAETGELVDLENYCRALAGSGQWAALAGPAAELARRTRDIEHIEPACAAMFKEGRFGAVAELLLEFQVEVERHPLLASHLGRCLLYQGRFAEARPYLAQALAQRGSSNDETLMMQLCIETGEWEDLPGVVSTVWDHRADRSARQLMAAAVLAADLDLPARAREFCDLAVATEGNDPHVLLTAWIVAMKVAAEDLWPEAQGWLQTASALSTSEGPIQQVDFEELVSQLPERQQRTTEVNRLLNQAEAPLFIAAKALGVQLTGMVLGNALRNRAASDPRSRWVIPIRQGIRPDVNLAGVNGVAFDFSSLLVLQSIGCLEMALDSVPGAMIPHGCLGQLFEDRRELKRHQPSRTRAADEILRHMAKGELREFDVEQARDRGLVASLGEDLGALLHSCEARGARLIRPSPVHRAGSLLREEVDMSPYFDVVADTRMVLNTVASAGLLDSAGMNRATAFIYQVDKGWEAAAPLERTQTLVLEDVAVSYLQSAGLLGQTIRCFESVLIDPSVVANARAELDFRDYATELFDQIDAARRTIRDRINTGKLRVAPIPEGILEESSSPGERLFRLEPTPDVIISDDRGVNRYDNLTTNEGATLPIGTVVDVLRELHRQGSLSESELRAKELLLLRSTYGFMPVRREHLIEELKSALVAEGQLRESLELRAIREYLARLQMLREMMRPEETAYLTALRMEVFQAIQSCWSQLPLETAGAAASWLFDILPDPRAWQFVWTEPMAEDFAEGQYVGQLAAISFPFFTIGTDKLIARRDWVEREIVGPLSRERPDLLERVAEIVSQALTELAGDSEA